MQVDSLRIFWKYKINRNVSWAALKNNIFKLFLEEDPRKTLLHLQSLFETNIEPIRPGRKFSQCPLIIVINHWHSQRMIY